VRFHADGPNLPDDLLVARDDGKVLFFCGSGVSIAKARLPGFLGLAEKVLEELHALPDSAPRQFTKLAGTLQESKVPGVGSIVAADRIFGLLERDFAPADIVRAVGSVLKPKTGTDPSAHRILLDLGRTPNSTVQLVTTNFERLFEDAAPRLPIWTPDRLPDLKQGGFQGIVHLHGLLDPSYTQAVGGNLVLSSAEFGRAYLSQGWATRFIQDATERYTIVFVGYAADDPPVQYLLEALSRDHGYPRQPIYAFQEGLQSEAVALWEHKGVTAIPYDNSRGDYALLWQTLAAWAERARNPEAWRKALLRRAASGPERLAPHERGQVMHLAMTPDGVKSITIAKPQLPANWLLVFDPAERYETPGRRVFTAEQAAIDPFRDYGLDSDPSPKPDGEGELFRRRELPAGVLNALVTNGFDPPDTSSAAICGNGAVSLLALPPRLRALTAWIGRIAGQTLAIWWACNKSALNPDLLQAVEARFGHGADPLADIPRTAWRYIVDANRPIFRRPFDNIYGLRARITREGWSQDARSGLIDLLRPTLQVSRSIATRPAKEFIRVNPFEFLGVNLDYHDDAPMPDVPDNEVAPLVPMIRRLLEEVSSLELASGRYALDAIPPIHFDERLAGRAYERDHGFNRLIFFYVELFERLLVLEPKLALREFDAWQAQENTLFDRLTIWACGVANLLPAERATRMLAGLPDSKFWTDRGQRDLLLSLKARWPEFDPPDRAAVETRLLKGPPRDVSISRSTNRQWRGYKILNRVLWLIDQGCAFTKPTKAALARARAAAPDWRDEYADHAADSLEGSGGLVETDSSFAGLADVPLSELIARCIEAAGRDHDTHVDRDPLAGLVAAKPVKVMRALLLEKPPEAQARLWAWSKFLHRAIPHADTPRLTCLIARRLVALPDQTLILIIQSASAWLANHSAMLYEHSPALVGDLVDRITGALAMPGTGQPARTRRRQDDWRSAAHSAPAGRLIATLRNDPALAAYPVGGGLPDEWRRRVESLLALPGELEQFALFQLAGALGWLFTRDAAWTEKTILSALDAEGERQEAVLMAFLHAQGLNDRRLYDRFKVPVFKLISGELSRPKVDVRAFGQFTLMGWRRKDGDDRWLSDMDMRTALVRGAQEFRTNVLWHIGQWSFPEKYYFLSQVWPLQLAARSATVTDRLCGIALADAAHFGELARAVMPHLTPLQGGSLMFGTSDARQTFAAHPQIALELYWRILPEDSRHWPYDAHHGLEYLHEHVKALRSDPRMIELMRRRRKGYF